MAWVPTIAAAFRETRYHALKAIKGIINCADGAGNPSSQNVTVSVPKDQGKK